jgi:hypothetical protein
MRKTPAEKIAQGILSFVRSDEKPIAKISSPASFATHRARMGDVTLLGLIFNPVGHLGV